MMSILDTAINQYVEDNHEITGSECMVILHKLAATLWYEITSAQDFPVRLQYMSHCGALYVMTTHEEIEKEVMIFSSIETARDYVYDVSFYKTVEEFLSND